MSAPAVVSSPAATVTVDPTRCTGHGLCADWLPEQIVLDEWGYPIVDRALPADRIRAARRAAAECPVRALLIQVGPPAR